MAAEKELNFADQLPVPDAVPAGELNPRAGELSQYKEMFFDPRYDGYDPELEYICDLPFYASTQVKASKLGVGFEVLDHRTGYDFQQVLPFARNTGVKWARVQTGWQRAETTPGVYDFGWLDEIVDGLRDAGIQPWLSLSFGNGLYMDGAEPLPPRGNFFFSPTRFGEKGKTGWTNYCKAMAEHFKDRVFHWEVWNEPNAGFLRKPNMGKVIQAEEPEVYAELVAITAKALRSVQPEAKVIGGAISGCAICNEYIQGLFDNGIAEHIDCFSYHPYQAVPEIFYEQRLKFIRDLIAASGKNITIWQGENGRTSRSKEEEGRQARYLTRRYLTDLRMEVEVSSYFLICDVGNGYLPNGQLHSYGILDATDPDHYRPKLSYRAMQSFAYLFDSQTELMNGCFELNPLAGWGKNNLPLEAASGVTCAFRRHNIPIFAYYHPTHLNAEWEIRPVRVHTWVHPSMQFQKPILIDPITAKVYRIRKMTEWCDGNYGNLLVIPKLPLLDYPLFVTDAALLDSLEQDIQ